MNNNDELELAACCLNHTLVTKPAALTLCLNCESIELDCDRVRLVLDNARIYRELESCDTIEINGFTYRKVNE